MIVLGLTGSVAMGKSTTAQMFVDEGVPVFDADAEVHRLYDGVAVPLIEKAFPGTTANGRVDREKLAAQVLGNAAALARLESIVHPLVRAAENTFRKKAAAEGARVAVLNVPLLLETGGHERVDAVVVVTAPPEVQRARIFARPGMTDEKFKAMLSRQLADSEKRWHADFLIDTSRGLEAARGDVQAILKQLLEKGPPARRKSRNDHA
jgi:dephospho-CoA kinase